MEKKIEDIYSEVTQCAISQINDPNVFNIWISFQTTIFTDLHLPAPYESSTNQFLNEFSPKIIANILKSNVKELTIIQTFSQILQNYIYVLATVFNQPFVPFIESCIQIFDQNKSFYSSLKSLNPKNTDNTFADINQLFQSCNFYQQINDYINSIDRISYQHALALIRLLNNSPDSQSQNSKFYMSQICLKVYSIISSNRNLNVKDIDEKSLFSLLELISSINQELKQSINDLLIDFCISFVQSSSLEKRFNGLTQILKVCSLNKSKEIYIKIQQSQILENILNNFHPQLLKPFISLVVEFLKNDLPILTYLSLFWDIANDQQSTTSKEFFKEMEIFFTNESIRSIFFNKYLDSTFTFISESLNFSESALLFLQRISYVVDDTNKEKIFNSLLIFSANYEEVPKNLSDTILMYMPKTNDSQQRIINDSFEMIRNNYHVQLASNLIQRINIVQNEWSSYLNRFLDLLNTDNAIQLIDLLEFFVSNLPQTILFDQFDRIIRLFSPLRNTRINFFFINTISKYSIEMKKAILEFVCLSNEVNQPLLNFIFMLYDEIKQKVQFEQILDFAFRTNNNDFYHLLKNKMPIKEFINFCMKDWSKTAALNGLFELIYQKEHFLNRYIDQQINKPYNNRYIDHDHLIFIRLQNFFIDQLYLNEKTKYSELLIIISMISTIAPQSIVLQINNKPVDKNAFVENNSIINVLISLDSNPSEPYEFPSLYLFQFKDFIHHLTENLENEQSGQIIFKILNFLPTLQEFEIKFGINFNWDLFLNNKQPYHMLYHLHTIANRLISKNEIWVNEFFKNGGALKLFQIFVNSQQIPVFTLNGAFQQKNFLFLLHLISILLTEKQSFEAIQQIPTENFSDLIKTSSAIISTNKSHRVIRKLLKIIQLMTQIRGIQNSDQLTESFIKLFEYSIFDNDKQLRDIASSFIQHPEIRKLNIMADLLPKAFENSNWDFIKSYQSTSSNPLLFWNSLLDSTFSYFSNLKKNDANGTWLNLCSSYPSNSFLDQLYSTLISLINQIEEIPRLNDLLMLLIDDILFNQIIYFNKSLKLFELLNLILTKNNSLIEYTISKINQTQNEMKSIQSNQDFKVIQNENRYTGINNHFMGLKNLGSTCYMASLIQQLYSIPILRESIFKLNEDIDWLKELQYLFLKLLIYPSKEGFIDPSNFVNVWKDWNNEPIDPRQQQDAEEFYSLLLSRLENKLNVVDSLFKGTIINHTQGEGVHSNFSSNSIEDFYCLPIEVKGHSTLESSLEAFIAPDRFEGTNKYQTDANDLIDAYQTHKVFHNAPILVITLKRFQFNISTQVREKINSVYQFPIKLDISSIVEKDRNKIDENLIKTKHQDDLIIFDESAQQNAEIQNESQTTEIVNEEQSSNQFIDDFIDFLTSDIPTSTQAEDKQNASNTFNTENPIQAPIDDGRLIQANINMDDEVKNNINAENEIHAGAIANGKNSIQTASIKDDENITRDNINADNDINTNPNIEIEKNLKKASSDNQYIPLDVLTKTGSENALIDNTTTSLDDFLIDPNSPIIEGIQTSGEIGLKYELYGVVLHKGTANSGHYISHIKGTDNIWRVYNDTSVTTETESEMLQTCYGGIQKAKFYDEVSKTYIETDIDNGNAYMLFYRNIDYNFNQTSNQCISPTLLERLVTDIKKDNLIELSSCEEYFKFIVNLATDITDILPLLGPSNGISPNCKSIIYNQLVDKIQTNQVLRDSILNYFILHYDDAMNIIEYVRIVLQIIPETPLIDFLNTLIHLIPSIPELALNQYCDCITEFNSVLFDRFGKIDISEWCLFLQDYLSKQKHPAVVNLFFNLAQNDPIMIPDSLVDLIRIDFILKTISTNKSIDMIRIIIHAISKNPNLLNELFDRFADVNPYSLAKLFVIILACDTTKELFLKYLTNYLQNPTPIFISQLFSNIYDIIKHFLPETITAFFDVSQYLIHRFLLFPSKEIRSHVLNIFLLYFSNFKDISNHLSKPLTYLLQQIDSMIVLSQAHFDNYQMFVDRYNFTECFTLLTTIAKHVEFDVSSYGVQFANLLWNWTVVFSKFDEICTPRLEIIIFITTALKKDQSEQFFTPKVVDSMIKSLNQLGETKRQNELDKFGCLYIDLIEIIPPKSCNNFILSPFFFFILKCRSIMTNVDLSLRLYKVFVNQFNELMTKAHSHDSSISFAKTFFHDCFEQYVKAGTLVPVKMAIYIMKQNRFIANDFFSELRYDFIWRVLASRTNRFVDDNQMSPEVKIPLDSSVFPLFKLLGIFVQQFSSIDENKISKLVIFPSSYMILSDYFNQSQYAFDVLFQILCIPVNQLFYNNVPSVSGPFVFFDSLLALKAPNAVYQLYKSLSPYLNNILRNSIPQARFRIAIFLVNILKIAVENRWIQEPKYLSILSQELFSILDICCRQYQNSQTDFKLRKKNRKIIKLLLPLLTNKWKYLSNSDTKAITRLFNTLIQSPNGFYYFLDKNVISQLINMITIPKPIELIQNAQQYVLEIVKGEFSKQSVDEIANIKYFLELISLHYKVDFITKIQADSQSMDNLQKWSSMIQNEDLELFLISLLSLIELQ